MVGNSGSGKTTLGRALAAALGVPFVEIDSLVHQPGWAELSREELRKRVSLLIAADGFVIDGNYRSRVGDLVLGRADTVVWLDLPKWTVRLRVLRRTLRRAVTRQELWNGNKEPWSNLYSRDPTRSVVVWSWTHHEAYRAQYEQEMAETAGAVRWVRLRSAAEVRRFLTAARVSPPAAPS
ncbi:MAG: AAA family ATPase [Acidimicrobiia bacterium]|nr:AAA family ATPase [Acidimicrobiia bacterium]